MVESPSDVRELESEKPSEPKEWTPAEVREAFRRYDLIIALGVMLTVIFAASFRSSAPDLWQRLRTGQLIAENFPSFPTVHDFAYTAPEGVAAVNSSWLYDLGSHGLYQTGEIALFGQQFHPLVLMKVVVVFLAALLLLTIRHRGPTLAWHSLCVLLAVVAMGSWLDVGPQAVAYLLLSMVLFLWHRATSVGRPWTLIWLLPIAVLWANLDESFVILPIVVTALGIGEMLRPRTTDVIQVPGPSRGRLAAVIVGCWLAGFVSPYLWWNAAAPWIRTTWDVRFFIPLEELKHTGWAGIWYWFGTQEVMKLTEGGQTAVDWTEYYANLQNQFGTWPMLAWMAILVLAIGSFLVVAKPLPWSRLFLLVCAFGLPWAAERWLPFSAMLLAFIASLNGQQAILRRFGAERTDVSGLIASQLARMGLIVLVFLALLGTLTGRIQGQEAQFGYSIAEEELPIQAARRLREMNLEGQLFTIGPSQRVASYLLWDGPTHSSFIDFRWPRAGKVTPSHELARRSLLRNLDPNAWREVFRQWGITHVVLDARDDSRVMRDFRRVLSQRPEFAPIHADDQCIIYGVLLESPDYPRIRKERIRAAELAFGDHEPTPSATVEVRPPSWIFDSLWRYRYVEKPDGLIEGAFYLQGGDYLCEPASNLVAIARLRKAVALASNSPQAHLQLGLAYMQLTAQELAAIEQDWRRTTATELADDDKSPEDKLAAGRIPMPERRPAIALSMHHQAAMASLQNALTAGENSAQVHRAIKNLCEWNSFPDLELMHAEALRDQLPEGPEAQALDERISRLRRYVAQQQSTYDDYLQADAERMRKEATAWEARAVEFESKAQSAGDAEKSGFAAQAQFARQQVEAHLARAEKGDPYFNSLTARSLGLIQRAYEELEAAPVGTPELRWQIYAMELYLFLGRPQKALDRIQNLENQLQPPIRHWLMDVVGAVPNRALPPTYHKFLWCKARCHYAAGQLDQAAENFAAAVAYCRQDRVYSLKQLMLWQLRTGSLANNSGNLLFKGALRVLTDDNDEGECLFDLGLIELELGSAKKAVSNFHTAVKSEPHHRLRPVIDMYLRAVEGQGLPVIAPRDPKEDVARHLDPPKADAADQEPKDVGQTSEVTDPQEKK